MANCRWRSRRRMVCTVFARIVCRCSIAKIEDPVPATTRSYGQYQSVLAHPCARSVWKAWAGSNKLHRDTLSSARMRSAVVRALSCAVLTRLFFMAISGRRHLSTRPPFGNLVFFEEDLATDFGFRWTTPLFAPAGECPQRNSEHRCELFRGDITPPFDRDFVSNA